MNNRNLYNERNLQNSREKVLNFGTILLAVGTLLIVFGFVMVFVYDWTEMLFFVIIGTFLAIWGLGIKLMQHQQEQMMNLFKANSPSKNDMFERMGPQMEELFKKVDEIMKDKK